MSLQDEVRLGQAIPYFQILKPGTGAGPPVLLCVLRASAWAPNGP